MTGQSQAQPPVASAAPRPEPNLLRDWRSTFFAPVGDGQRRRRGSDGLRLAGAILALVCCVLIIRYDSRIDRAITQVIHPPPRSITWLVTVVYDVGAFGVTIVLVGLALVARRWVIARDIALSAAVTAAVSGILILLLGSSGGQAQRNRDPRLLGEFPGPADRPLHGGHHGRAALPGPRSAAPHRAVRRLGRAGLGGRRAMGCRSTSWAAWPSAGGQPCWSASSLAHRSASPRPRMCGCCSTNLASVR